MKALISISLIIFTISAIITHLWTTIIAFSQGGIFAGIITFISPFASEIYWIFAMFGVNNVYSTIAIIQVILGLLIFPFSGYKR